VSKEVESIADALFDARDAGELVVLGPQTSGTRKSSSLSPPEKGQAEQPTKTSTKNTTDKCFMRPFDELAALKVPRDCRFAWRK